MTAQHKINSLLQEVAGDALVQEVPYPIVLPTNLESLSRIMNVAITENFHVLPIGSGSSFAENFTLTKKNVIVVSTRGLKNKENLSPTSVRIQAGALLQTLINNLIDTKRKTLGGLLACELDAPSREILKLLLPRITSIQVLTSECEFKHVSIDSARFISGHSYGNLWFSSGGRMGMIVSADFLNPIPIASIEITAMHVNENTTKHTIPLSKNDLIHTFDKNNVFAW